MTKRHLPRIDPVSHAEPAVRFDGAILICITGGLAVMTRYATVASAMNVECDHKECTFAHSVVFWDGDRQRVINGYGPVPPHQPPSEKPPTATTARTRAPKVRPLSENGIPLCIHGHELTFENRTRRGDCKKCAEASFARWKARKADNLK